MPTGIAFTFPVTLLSLTTLSFYLSLLLIHLKRRVKFMFLIHYFMYKKQKVHLTFYALRIITPLVASTVQRVSAQQLS